MFNSNDNRMSNSYESLEIVKASDIPELVAQCQASGVNLLIYGEPGCGKSSIIEELAAKGEYNLVELGAASLCEEMINGIPARDTASNKITYAVPEWLDRIMSIVASEPDKKVILFIDELTLAAPEVMNSLQLLLTARAVPTHPDKKLPDNVVIVAATNTAEDSNEGSELSRPLKTRFMSVRMTNSPAEFKSYLLSILDEKLPSIKEVLGDLSYQFVEDVVKDLSNYWCDNSKFYGTNPRTIMNFLKMCNYVASQEGKLDPQKVSSLAQRNTGHRLVTTNWVSHEAAAQAERTATIRAGSELIPSDEIMKGMSEWELESLVTTIERSKMANTKAGIEATIKATKLIYDKRKAQEGDK